MISGGNLLAVRWLRVIAITCTVVQLSACATNWPQWATKYAPTDFVDGTRVLAEATASLSREDVLTGTYAGQQASLTAGLYQRLLSLDIEDSEIVDGSQITARTFCYGHNSAVGCLHQGIYHVRLTPGERKMINVQVDGHNRVRTRGDLLDVELRRTHDNTLIGRLVGVYRQFDDWRDCRFASLAYGGRDWSIAVMVPYGPPLGQWIECASLEKDGWSRRAVTNAPPNGTPNIPMSEWIKLPPRPKSH